MAPRAWIADVGLRARVAVGPRLVVLAAVVAVCWPVIGARATSTADGASPAAPVPVAVGAVSWLSAADGLVAFRSARSDRGTVIDVATSAGIGALTLAPVQGTIDVSVVKSAGGRLAILFSRCEGGFGGGAAITLDSLGPGYFHRVDCRIRQIDPVTSTESGVRVGGAPAGSNFQPAGWGRYVVYGRTGSPAGTSTRVYITDQSSRTTRRLAIGTMARIPRRELIGLAMRTNAIAAMWRWEDSRSRIHYRVTTQTLRGLPAVAYAEIANPSRAFDIVSGLAIEGRYVYWATSLAHNEIVRARLHAGHTGRPSHLPLDPGYPPVAVAVTPTSVFFTRDFAADAPDDCGGGAKYGDPLMCGVYRVDPPKWQVGPRGVTDTGGV
jgi:hypothetical protein